MNVYETSLNNDTEHLYCTSLIYNTCTLVINSYMDFLEENIRNHKFFLWIS
jgi:hypothetical protein